MRVTQGEKKEQTDTYYVYERNYGSFTRTFTLPEGADPNQVRAEMHDGVLDINKSRATLAVADKALRVVFHTFGFFAGLNGYHLPDMDIIADLSHKYYRAGLESSLTSYKLPM